MGMALSRLALSHLALSHLVLSHLALSHLQRGLEIGVLDGAFSSAILSLVSTRSTASEYSVLRVPHARPRSMCCAVRVAVELE